MGRSAIIVGSVVFFSFISTAWALGTGAKAPEIGLKDTAGRPVAIADLRGKVVLVDFWASWCAPCKQELPVLEKLYAKYKGQGLEIVGVNIDNDAANMKSFLRRTPLSFRVVPDTKRKVAAVYEPPKMPSSYLIDKKGIVRHVHAGFRGADAAKIEAEIKALLSE